MQQAKSLFIQLHHENNSSFRWEKVFRESKRTGKVFNPATGEQSGEVIRNNQRCQCSHISKKAFETWSNVPPLQRARVMFKFKDLIEKNSDELTKIIVSEHGKAMMMRRDSQEG